MPPTSFVGYMNDAHEMTQGNIGSILWGLRVGGAEMPGKHRPARPACGCAPWQTRCMESPGEGDASMFDDIEREAMREEGFDPDDPATKTAIDLVRWELALLRPDPEVEPG